MNDGEDLWNVLYEVKQVIGAGNDWVTFDTETTGLQGEIIAWAVCSSDGSTLGSGYIKPTVPVEPSAREIHGITDEQLADAPSFAEVLPELWRLLEQKTIIIYNAEFDLSRFETSLQALYPFPATYDAYCEQSRRLWRLREQAHCAMEWFATVYGQRHHYYRSYTWQKLSTACAYFGISLEEAHDAASDARATALLAQKLVEMAEQQLPAGYHPPRDEPCSGGCGEMSGPFHWDNSKIWYCLECGLSAGINHLCPMCEGKGKRTVVTSYRSPRTAIAAGTLCWDHEYDTKLASGEWHICPYCTTLVLATMKKQKRCEGCKRKGRSRPLTGPYEVPVYRHQTVVRNDKRVECIQCKQTWKSDPSGVCPGVPVYPLGEVPGELKTFTQLRHEQKQPKDRALPDGAYRILKAPYYRFLYDERNAVPLERKREV